MKPFIFIIASFFILSASAENYIQELGQRKTKTISVQKLKGLRVNEACLKNQKECLGLIALAKGQGTQLPKADHTNGNPASVFCENNNGVSEILRDQKNNEYDYCLLKGKYLVDSWDFYRHNQK